jgi:hypothetical protein
MPRKRSSQIRFTCRYRFSLCIGFATVEVLNQCMKFLHASKMGNASCHLVDIIQNQSIAENLCLFCPSLPIRLRRVSKRFMSYFPDEKLSELLPKTFESLGLYYGNPFTYCLKGDVESVWMMLVHGVDPRIVDQVRNNL